MIHLLKDKVALVASHYDSVTLSVTRLFLQQGASVIVISNSQPAFLKDALEPADQNRWMWLQADLANPVEARYCASEAVKRFGRADILFYYPNAEENSSFAPVGQSSEHAIITHAQSIWTQLVATLAPLRNSPSSNVIVVADTSTNVELSHVGEVQTEGHSVRIDLINARQSYQPKRQQSLTSHKQLTPERIARLSLSVLVKEKQEEVEWNEVLSWTSEYLDSAF